MPITTSTTGRILTGIGWTVLSLGLQPVVVGIMLRFAPALYADADDMGRAAWALCLGGALVGWLCAFRKPLNLRIGRLWLLMLGWVIGYVIACIVAMVLGDLEGRAAARWSPILYRLAQSIPWLALAGFVLLCAWLVRRAAARNPARIPCHGAATT
jgi:hypothetical protein